jgi:hypothetical protein
MNAATTSNRRRRAGTRDLAIAGSVLAVVVSIVGGSVIWGAAGAAAARDAGLSAAPVLAQPQSKVDRFPQGFPADQHGSGGIDPVTSQLLGVQAGTRYWLALDRSANVCLLAQSVSRPDLTAATCASGGDLEASGGSLQVDAGTWRVEAFLLPDSVDTSSLSAPWSAVADNLVTYAGASAGPSAAIELERDPGEAGAPLTLTHGPTPTGR